MKGNASTWEWFPCATCSLGIIEEPQSRLSLVQAITHSTTDTHGGTRSVRENGDPKSGRTTGSGVIALKWHEDRWEHTGSSTEKDELHSSELSRNKEWDFQPFPPSTHSPYSMHRELGMLLWPEEGSGLSNSTYCESLRSVTIPVSNRYAPNPWIQQVTLSFPKPSQTGKSWHTKSKQAKNIECLEEMRCQCI